MPRYRLKGTELEARQVTGVVEDAHAIAEWCNGRVTFNPLQIWFMTCDPYFEDTFEVSAGVGDYIVTQEHDFYDETVFSPYPQENFEKNYERID